MLLSIVKFLQGYMHVTLTGRAKERFLNLCCKKNILIWNLVPNKEAEGFDFCISLRGFRTAKELLKKTHTNLKIRKKCGLPFFLHRYRARKLFAFGVLLCIMLLFGCSRYVWKIEINGTTSLSEDIILTWLSAQQKSFGTKKSEINCAALEAGLRSDYDEIAWTSVKLEGTKLTIDIQESLSEDDGTLKLPEEGAWDIVASEDATIASIYTRQGTPMVEKGTVVSKGAVLISGRLDIMDDNGEVANYRYVVSDGDVTGTVERTYKNEIPRKYQKKSYTGEEEISYTLQIGGFRLPIRPAKASYGACETTVNDYQLEILKNFYLPVHLLKTTRKAYVYEQATYTEDEVETLAQQSWESFLENFTQKGLPIIVKNVKIDTDETNCVIRGSIDAEVPLITYAPTERISQPEQAKTEDGDDVQQ